MSLYAMFYTQVNVDVVMVVPDCKLYRYNQLQYSQMLTKYLLINFRLQ